MKKELLYVFALVCGVSAAIYFLQSPSLVTNIFLDGFYLVLIPVSIVLALGLKRENIGVSLKEWRKILLYSISLVLIALPIMYFGKNLPGFMEYYPRFAAQSSGEFIFHELLLLPSFLFLEFFYRGFSLFMLRKYSSDSTAIVLHAIPYALVHIGKPGLEVPYSFVAGIVFAYVCLKSKSFMPAFLTHYSTSVIFDFLCW
jgi:membrane protease YdiL (CAAX protease family)